MTAQASSLASISNNATAISTDDVTAIVTSASLIVIGGSLGKVGSYNGTVWNNYNSGTGLASNATVVGANKINAIVRFGTTTVFGAATGRLGSYDGTNFKNFDGTGTGTGVFSNQTVVGTSDITALSVLGSNLWIGSSGGVEIPMTAAGVFVPLYTLSTGAQIANLLTGEYELNQVYVWRYESPNQRFYLVLLTGNSLSLGYVLDDTAKILYQLNAKYAVVQVGNGFSRHILTGRFYKAANVGPNGITGLNGQGISIVGYQALSSVFTPTPTYPTTPDTVGTVLQQNALMGGLDTTYNNTASPTNIQAEYYPNMENAANPGLITNGTPNTNNLINGYGKLTNNSGEVLALPFEIRVGVIAGVQSFLSAAVAGTQAFDNLGVLLTNVGEFDPTYIPAVHYGTAHANLIYRFNRSFVFQEGLRGSPAPDPESQRQAIQAEHDQPQQHRRRHLRQPEHRQRRLQRPNHLFRGCDVGHCNPGGLGSLF